VATAKVIPFAVPRSAVEEAEGIAGEGGAMIRVELLEHRKVGLILSTSDGTRERIENQFAPLRERIEALGSELARVDHVSQNEDTAERELANSIKAQSSGGMDLIILAGETAIMDREDVAPRAIERAGGSLEVLGAPVDPGNLLMLSYIGELPILGAPGCARSRKVNVVDWVLPRLLVGERLTRADIASMGHGGLLDDVPERPMPRSAI
jgi:molybdenum cofactor cytidylyltransferase